MGWKSSIDITRQEAINQIEQHLDLESMDNEALAALLELVMGGENHGHNYGITNATEGERQ